MVGVTMRAAPVVRLLFALARATSWTRSLQIVSTGPGHRVPNSLECHSGDIARRLRVARRLRFRSAPPPGAPWREKVEKSVATCEPYPYLPRFLSGGWGSLRWGAPERSEPHPPPQKSWGVGVGFPCGHLIELIWQGGALGSGLSQAPYTSRGPVCFLSHLVAAGVVNPPGGYATQALPC